MVPGLPRRLLPGSVRRAGGGTTSAAHLWENARAVVRRLVLPEPGHADSGPLWPPFAADDDPL